MASQDDDSVERIPGEASSRMILLCDHASNAIPAGYDDLGLNGAQRERHIAYDIGAAALTRALAATLRATAILTRYSRLLIDPNRGEHDPTLIMRLSDGAIIPGNQNVDAQERETRLARFYRPYHRAIEREIEARLAAGAPPVLVSLHSFTPEWRGRSRPWHVGILWDKDPRLAMPMIEALCAEPGLCVGDNQPYSGRLKGDTLHRHGTRRGLAHALIEVRQDLIAGSEGQQDWAARLAGVLHRVLGEPHVLHAVSCVQYFGSWTDRPILGTTESEQENQT